MYSIFYKTKCSSFELKMSELKYLTGYCKNVLKRVFSLLVILGSKINHIGPYQWLFPVVLGAKEINKCYVS